MFCHDSRRRHEILKGVRIVNRRQDHRSPEWNKFAANEEIDAQLFQDEIIRLTCFGDCGSITNTLLVEKTNLSYFKCCEKPERFMDVISGRGSNPCYAKLTFESPGDEKTCLNLMKTHLKYDAKNRPMGVEI